METKQAFWMSFIFPLEKRMFVFFSAFFSVMAHFLRLLSLLWLFYPYFFSRSVLFTVLAAGGGTMGSNKKKVICLEATTMQIPNTSVVFWPGFLVFLLFFHYSNEKIPFSEIENRQTKRRKKC